MIAKKRPAIVVHVSSMNASIIVVGAIVAAAVSVLSDVTMLMDTRNLYKHLKSMYVLRTTQARLYHQTEISG